MPCQHQAQPFLAAVSKIQFHIVRLCQRHVCVYVESLTLANVIDEGGMHFSDQDSIQERINEYILNE